jgi:hypothetical protein
MSYQGEDYADLVTTTLESLERQTWADIVVDEQFHIAMPYVLSQERTNVISGQGIQFNARFYTNNAAKNVKLGETDEVTEVDTQKTGSVDWRHTTTHWAIEERIISMNRNPARLVSLLETKRVDAMVSLAEVLEENFWTAPTSTSDDTAPHGIPYWIVKDNTTTTGAFQGGRASGFTGSHPGGLDPDTYSRWKNWSQGYTDINKTDLVRKWRKAAYKCNFTSPVAGPFSNVDSGNAYSGNPAGYGGRISNYLYATVYDVTSVLEESLEAQNDNLGNDVASKDGMTTFRRNPVRAVPYLDNNDTSDPVYGISFKCFHITFLEGEYMRPTKVKPWPGQHRMLAQFIDNSYNFYCNDRRAQFVLYKP